MPRTITLLRGMFYLTRFAALTTLAAEQLLLGTAIQESLLTLRHQLGTGAWFVSNETYDL